MPIVNDEEQIGYCINFEKSNVPNGYLIINIVNRNAEIIEYAFDGKNPYELLINYSMELGYKNNTFAEKYLYSPSPFTYGIVVEDNYEKIIYGTDEIITEKSKIDNLEAIIDNSPADNDFYNGITYWNINFERYYGTSLPGINNFTPFVMSKFAVNANEGNCSPTGMTNMLMYWKSRGWNKIGTEYEVYNKIVSYSGYDSSVGGLTRAKGISAAKKYMKELGYKVSDFDYWSDPFSYFKNDIDNGHTVATSIRNSSVGHLVIAVGWRIHWDGWNDSSKVEYLRVMDGWYSSTNRYLQFKNYYNSVAGTVFKVNI